MRNKAVVGAGRVLCAAALWVIGVVCVPWAGAQTWAELGPVMDPAGADAFTGRISAVVCSKTNQNLYYCTGADGGVWKSTNGGSSWIPLTDGQVTTSMGALALDPVDEAIIYAGTGEANFANHSRPGQGILKSTDGGATWSLFAQGTFAGRCISRIVINPSAHATLYCGVTRAGGFPAPAAAKGHPLANGPRGVFKSIDAGMTWTQLGGGTTGLPQLDCTDLAMDPVDPTILYAAIGFIFGDATNGVYKSTNSGATWTKLAGGLPSSPGRIALAVAPTNRNRLYALIVNPADSAGGSGTTLGAYRSDNAGGSWTNLSIGAFQSTYGWYLCTVGVSTTSADTVIMAGLSPRRSTNAGATWATLSIPHPDCHTIAYDAAGRVLIGCDGGLFRLDTITPFKYLNGGLGTIQFYAGLSTHPTDDSVILGGIQDNGTRRRSSTSSTAWTDVLGGDGGWTQIDQVNPLIQFAEFQDAGNLYKSTDGGMNFSPTGGSITGRTAFVPPYVIDPNNHNRILYGTERVWESTTGGGGWHTLSADLTGGGTAAIRALAIAPSDSHVVYAATNDGRVLLSTNFGATFSIILQNNPGWPRVTRELSIDPSDPLTLYLAGAGYGATQVRRTRDAGQTWEALDAGLPDVPVNVVAVDARYPTPRLYAGTDAGVYLSRDDGATWAPHSVVGPGALPNACVVDLLLEPGRARLIAATQGRGAWVTPVYCPSDIDENGFVNGDDFDSFVGDFYWGDPGADFDANGFVNGDDFDEFSWAFEAGC